jgi:hypothetical protein
VNFHVGGLLACIERCRHVLICGLR